RGAELARPVETAGSRIDRPHLAAPQTEHLHPELPDRAAADDERPSGRQPSLRAEDAGERLHPDAVAGGNRIREGNDVRRAEPLREAARRDAHLRELAARRLVPRPAPLAPAAGNAVHDRDPAPVGELALHLVADDGPGRPA